MPFDVVELAPDPNEFVALTVNVYETPDVNPLTVIVPDPAWVSVPVILPGVDVAV
jgi:hypothetical protein